MKASWAWLAEYVEMPDVSTDEGLQAFCDKLDLTGTGVEGVERLGGFDRVVTGQILTKEAHPDSDHLWVCTVDVGSWSLDDQGNPRPLNIVCGAQNFNAGDHVVVALVGAVLPGDFKIQKSKLRGVVSEGMNCSARELGIGEDHAGIMILPEDAPIGMTFGEYAATADVVFDLEITPNRPDCLSVIGLAREVGAIYSKDLKDPLDEMAQRLVTDKSAGYCDDLVSVTIEDSQRCPRYTARVIKGVTIGPSPDWLVRRLAAIGQRSINNIVDITNYVLYWCGQPLHAFDLNTLKGSDGKASIVVRAAKPGEILTTLDGAERHLTPDMTVIATPERGAVALAGVMGGLETEITETTTDILLEAATFEPGRTSRTSRNLGLISESSLRYERGVDDHGIAERSAAAAALMVEVAGGQVCAAHDNAVGIIDEWPLVSAARTLEFRIPRFNAMMGTSIDDTFIADKLTRLGCVVADGSESTVLQVCPPTYRPDLEREIDLYEEVLRLWGMDQVTSTLPESSERVGRRSARARLESQINTLLRASALSETMTYSFASPQDVLALGLSDLASTAVELINPLAGDHGQMRQLLLPGLLRSVAYNQSHGVNSVALYEMGTVFTARPGKKTPKETVHVGGVMAGFTQEPSWNTQPPVADFFDVKGVLENLCNSLHFAKVRFKAIGSDEAPFLQPGRAALLLSDGIEVGWLGEVHPQVAKAFGATAPIAAFELDVAAIQRAAHDSSPLQEISAYPSVSLDVALVVDEAVTNEALLQVMRSAGGKLLQSIRLFDVYRDADRLGAGKKSMAFGLSFCAPDRTLTSAEAENALNKILTKVAKATGAEIRS